MSKTITPKELATIVATLLLSPDKVGELEQPSAYRSFVDAIGTVVANHCGGKILGACESSDALRVGPSESLPDINQNIWSVFDVEGFRDQPGYVSPRLEELFNAKAMYAVVVDAAALVKFETSLIGSPACAKQCIERIRVEGLANVLNEELWPTEDLWAGPRN